MKPSSKVSIRRVKRHIFKALRVSMSGFGDLPPGQYTAKVHEVTALNGVLHMTFANVSIKE